MSILDKFKKTSSEPTKEVKQEEQKKEEKPYTARGLNLSILKKPWITEKSVTMSREGKYMFLVPLRSSSFEIKKAAEALYNVKVVSVNIVNIKEKKRRLGRTMGTIPGYRKAILKLQKGQSIDILPR